MNQRITEWLAGPSSQPNQSILERMAELIAVNGGIQVRGWGFLSMGGMYGRHGLEQEEAFELMHYQGMIHAFDLAFGGDFDHWLLPQLKAEWEKEMLREEAAQSSGSPSQGEPSNPRGGV